MRVIPRRRAPLLFILFVCSVVGILLYRSRLLFGLLVQDGARDSIPMGVSHPPYDELNHTKYHIPKIIHQTYIDENIPAHWREPKQTTQDLHPDWEYMFWTDASADSFILTHYPSFHPVYTSYRYPIQRADALRYFLLYHFGGIYVDLDLKPSRPFTPLLQFPAFACRTAPTGISNDILGSRPGHPFYKLAIENLKPYDRNWLVPYITVMYTTGPLFLSALWIQYLGTGPAQEERSRMRLLFPYSTKPGESYGYLLNVQGSSWHRQDAEVIFWMGRHWALVTIAGFVIGFSVAGLTWLVIKKIAELRGERRYGKERSGEWML